MDRKYGWITKAGWVACLVAIVGFATLVLINREREREQERVAERAKHERDRPARLRRELRYWRRLGTDAKTSDQIEREFEAERERIESDRAFRRAFGRAPARGKAPER